MQNRKLTDAEAIARYQQKIRVQQFRRACYITGIVFLTLGIWLIGFLQAAGTAR